MHPNDGRVISNFIMQALAGDDITLYGSGLQTPSFCYVDDLVEALLRSMRNPHATAGPVNVGTRDEFTMAELALAVIRLAGSSSRLTHRPLPNDDPRQRQPDITKIFAELDWQPRIELTAGLPKTIAYFRELRAAMQQGGADRQQPTRPPAGALAQGPEGPWLPS